MSTARERLATSPKLRDAVRRQLDEGLLERMRVGAAPRSIRDDDMVEFDDPGIEALGGVTDDLLEAIVQRVGRPPLLVKDHKVQVGTGEFDNLDDLPPDTERLIRSTQKLLPAVGRVEFRNFRMPWGGTAWVIAKEGRDRIVATNRHVAGLVARRNADGKGVFLRDPQQVKFGASVDFNEEHGATPADAIVFEVVDIPYLADDASPDVALLRITGKGLPDPIPLARTDPRVNDLVALVGYPARDSRNDATDQDRYFQDLYGVKRFAPGLVTQRLGAGSPLRHDCTSLGGNSGSPLIRLSDGKAVGLHFAGLYGQYNSAVGVTTLRRILKGRPVIVIAEQPAPTEAASDGVHEAAHFEGRTGYDPGFLEAGRTPWPGLPADVETDLLRPVDEVDEQPHELRYTHFGIKFSNERRQPLMTAVNIDGAHGVAIKRQGDKWFKDARIPLDRQLRKQDYADTEIDRGHLVRRQDPNWDPDAVSGQPSTLAQLANDDTFHYTNSAVQLGEFNSGSRLWLGLEDYVLGSAQTHGFKACVFTGPINRPDDAEVAPGVRAPREFFKVVVMPNADGSALHATAYVLSQGELIRDLLDKRSRTESVEGFTRGAYRTFQLSIADLSDATGYDFSAYASADPLGRVESVEGAPLFVALDAEHQIIL